MKVSKTITIILLSFFITSCATQSQMSSEKTTQNKDKTKTKELVQAYYYGADIMDSRN